MQTLSDFLASAPKTHLAKLYRRENPEAGLVSGAKVAGAVQSSALDPERLEAVLRALEPEGRRLLLAVYASEERGMLETELVRGCEGGTSAAGYWIGMLEYELLALRREGEHRSYHGFRELAPLLMPALLAEFAAPAAIPAQTAWISNVPHAASHFCHFLARAARGDLRLTQTGDLHRKSLADLAGGFTAGGMLSASVGREEALFLFRFAVDSDLLTESGGLLHLSASAPEWLEDGGEELARRMRAWWLRKRARGLFRLLSQLSSQPSDLPQSAPAGESGHVRGIAALAPLFAVYEGWDKSRARTSSELMTWENLPRLLRELWILGGAELAMHRGRVRWVRVLSGEEATGDGAAEPARGLPNFEALVPCGIPLNRLFQIELLAVRENDERMTRYRFTKDSVTAGLRAGVGTDSLEELAAWLGFEASARRVLAEWAATYAAASFREIFMLRVRDAERFADLKSFPQFMEIVTEVIPEYGFVLPRAAREQARELLRAFDLQPGDEAEPAQVGHRPVTGEGADLAWALPAFPHGEPVYRTIAQPRRPAAEGEPAARERGEETPAQRLRSLEQAIASQRSVEFTYGTGTARVKAQPLHVLRDRDPMKLIAVDLASGHRNEYALDRLQALRVGEMA